MHHSTRGGIRADEKYRAQGANPNGGKPVHDVGGEHFVFHNNSSRLDIRSYLRGIIVNCISHKYNALSMKHTIIDCIG